MIQILGKILQERLTSKLCDNRRFELGDRVRDMQEVKQRSR